MGNPKKLCLGFSMQIVQLGKRGLGGRGEEREKKKTTPKKRKPPTTNQNKTKLPHPHQLVCLKLT